ncbi:MAG TPA: MFS transporter [Acidimicrobiales bacterium]|nr:MFS transporter [Acidimicrobiales bacterium]
MGSRERGQFVLLCAATLFEFTALGIYFSALPLFVTDELAGSRADVGLAMGAFAVTAVLLRPFVGQGLDRRGRRPFLVAAPAILLVTSTAFAAVGSVPAVVGLRLLQGVTGAFFYTAAATVATDLAPVEKRADYLARFSLFLYGGFAIGPSLGEALVRHAFDWAWAAAGATALASFVVTLFVQETTPTEARSEVGARPPLRFLHPAAIWPGAVILTAATGYTAITAFSALYARRIGMGSSGPLYATFALSILVVRLVAGRLADRHGRVTVALPGMALAAAAMVLLAVEPPPPVALVGVGAFGAGFALVFPALLALTVDRVPDSERGAAVGSFTAFFDIGASGGGYAVGAVADRVGFAGGFGLPGALCMGGFVILARLGRHVRAEAAAAADESALPEPAGA